MTTYIKLYRKTLDSRVFYNEGLLKVWIWCLLKASYKERWCTIKTGRGTTEIKLLPGQFVFGRKKAAKELRMSPSTVWKRIKKLKNMQNLNIESNTHYSIITIMNWDTYQGIQENGDIEGDRQVTTKEHKQECNKKGKEYISAENVYETYKKTLRSGSKQRTLSNLRRILKKYPEADLIQAIHNYKSVTNGRELKYLKTPANFFGITEPFYQDYLPGQFEAPDNSERPDYEAMR